LRRLFRDLEEWLMAGTFAFMVLTTFAQVVSRYCLHRSISFTEELVRYLLIWVTMLGIAAAAKRRSHIGLRVLTLWRPCLARWTLLLGSLCACAFFAVLMIYGADMVWRLHRVQTTEALGWPMWWAGMSVPLGAALAIFRTVQACWSGWSGEDGLDGPAAGEGAE